MVKIEISDNAFKYLKKLAKPLEDTTVSVIDRIINDHMSTVGSVNNSGGNASLQFGISDMPDVTYTTIKSAEVGGTAQIKKDWNNILEVMIKSCLTKEPDKNKLLSLLEANVIQSKPTEMEVKKGYRYISEVGMAYQGLDAIRACKNIMILSQQYSIPVKLLIWWNGSYDKAAFPGKTATIVLP